MSQLVKNPPAMWETWVWSLVGKILWRRLPTPVFWPGEFHGLYSPWGRKELDTTEWLSLSLQLHTHSFNRQGSQTWFKGLIYSCFKPIFISKKLWKEVTQESFTSSYSGSLLILLMEFSWTVDHNRLENSSRDENTRPPYLPPEKSVCRSRSNS